MVEKCFYLEQKDHIIVGMNKDEPIVIPVSGEHNPFKEVVSAKKHLIKNTFDKFREPAKYMQNVFQIKRVHNYLIIPLLANQTVQSGRL